MESVKEFLQDLLLGGVSASIAKTCTAPIERVQVILQTQNSNPAISVENRYKGMTDCLVRIPKEQGFSSFWRGNFTNVMRYFPAQALNFAFNERYKKILCPYDPQKEFWKFFFGSMASGGAAGATSLIFVYPLDFGRTQLAADMSKKGERKYKGLVDCLTRIYQSDGMKGVYKGFGVSVILFMIYRALYFGGYTMAKEFMFKDKQKNNVILKFFVAQGITAFAGTFVFPLSTINRRMILQAGRKDAQYKNSFDCFKQIVANEGARSLYNGALANVIRGSGAALVLVLYDEMKKIFALQKEKK